MKPMRMVRNASNQLSHPVRVRGLKHCVTVIRVNLHRRTPCGCVG